eukprot:TRINITY_DN19243_c0_g1_i1.p1 TRINITY_DN19243_c0_g1~~TRINITY_DN19243_c0_g1_i1.p1  ORF type:complete len:465 (+),score=204.74 TRINITY_DN19243_c0_g1_i1:53-1396(+)
MKAVLACLLLAGSCTAWINTDVSCKLDASNAIVRSTTTVEAKNEGDSTNEYLIAVPESNLTSIAMLKISHKGGSGFSQIVSERVEVKDGNVIYKAILPSAVAKGASAVLRIRISLAGVQRPLPPTVKQSETQRVDFNGNAYFLSPYKTVKQTTTVSLASGSVESYTKDPAPVHQSGSSIVFGEYKDVKPFSSAPLRFHAANNKPFCMAKTLRRVFEISMWGNLAVEEWYDIEHVGAKLKGTFSRLDYSKPGKSAPSSFTTLTARLPAAAQDIYFRDDIGNISTSTVGYAKDPEKGTREVLFTQRFPLFGGWRTRFYFGYNMPLQYAMTTGGGVNKLRVPYASPIKDLWVKDQVVEVILPEGVPTPKVLINGRPTTDFTVEKRATYLDYSGRTVVILKDSMIASPERNEELEVDFIFSSSDLVWEPFYLIASFMTLFVSVIVFTNVLS